MPEENKFSKENLDNYLKEVAKEYRKLAGKNTPAEITLIGGAVILINYNFRKGTQDVDALIKAGSSMKDAINKVGDKYHLPNGWLNSDFKNTSSFSSNLMRYSQYYRTFSNIVTIRMVSAEYLVAMKLMSGRRYKHDLSDVVGIINEHQKAGNPIDYEQVVKAFENLYGDFNQMPKHSKKLLDDIFNGTDLNNLMTEVQEQEQLFFDYLLEKETRCPNLVTMDTADTLLDYIDKQLVNQNKTQIKPTVTEPQTKEPSSQPQAKLSLSERLASARAKADEINKQNYTKDLHKNPNNVNLE